MGRGESIGAQIIDARRRRNRALVIVASASVLGITSLLWLFSLDYTTVWFKLAGVGTAIIGIAFFVGIWIYSGAQLELEEHRDKLPGRRR